MVENTRTDSCEQETESGQSRIKVLESLSDRITKWEFGREFNRAKLELYSVIKLLSLSFLLSNMNIIRYYRFIRRCAC